MSYCYFFLVSMWGCTENKKMEDSVWEDSGTAQDTSEVDVMEPADSPDDSGSVDPTEGISEEWMFGEDTVRIEVEEQDGLRQYQMYSTHPQRDNGLTERLFSEEAGDPILRSGRLLTDALFAMAVHEAKENAVSQIQDAAFQNIKDCECFQTGELWNWVWTRDIAYATELGLAWLDTDRAKNSLLIKTSARKSGGGLEIIQDTGTGGSWPVSTDRVTWVRGAMAVLQHSDDQEFRDTLISVLQNTAETDRQYVYDARDGLYFGETSFLDWREQTYPVWVQNNPAQIAMSKSLSTNLNHLYLLRALESLTSEDHQSQALADAIDSHFWTGTFYSSFKTTELNSAPTHQQDLLATALAVLDLGTHPEALAQYPHSTVGAPVIFPQQQLTPIYHNRAIWPFVSSYAILAARKADNGAVFDANWNSIVRGAALNLSHMENLEWQTGKNWVEDGIYSGPVVNSRRQLWSVAGFLGAVVHGVFGLTKENGEWTADPVVPGDWFSEDATLTIDGTTFSIGANRLSSGNITMADESDWTNLYSAAIPSVSLSGTGDAVTLSFSSDEDARYHIYRDGLQVASDVTSPWTDNADYSACYAVVAELAHRSPASGPLCWWGDNYTRIQTIPISSFAVTGGEFSENHGRPHYENWGESSHHMQTEVVPNHTGAHYLQLVYGNGANGVDSGITAAVKRVTVTDSSGAEVLSASFVMPQLGAWDSWGDSNLVPVTLQAGESYTVVITDGLNMSYFAHYTDFVQAGGGSSSYNYVNIAEMKLLFMRE